MATPTCAKCQCGVKHAVPHGTTTGYQYHRCRCLECTGASRAAIRRHRGRNPEHYRTYSKDAQRRGRSDPEFVRRSSERRKKWCAQNPESLKAINTRTAEKRGRVPVTRRGNWTSAEDSVISRTDITLLEMAYMTGRSYNSIAIRRSRMRRLAA